MLRSAMRDDAKPAPGAPEVELVYDEDCPNVPEARAQLLRAFARARLEPTWREWGSDDPDRPPRLQGYGSPTILVGGRDVAAAQGQTAPCCRLYTQPDGSFRGTPDVDAIAEALAEQRGGAPAADAAGDDATPQHPDRPSWRAGLAMLPGIGAAMLPKAACPACWSAYAGFLSSVGLGVLLDTAWLLPLTAAFLALAVGALAYRARSRRGYKPFFVGLAAAAIVLVGKFVLGSDSAMYAGIAGLVAASIWNGWPRAVACIRRRLT